MVPCKSTAEEVSFEWSHRRISSADTKIRTTLHVSIIDSGSEKFVSSIVTSSSTDVQRSHSMILHVSLVLQYEGPVLAFILDHLLPSGSPGDTEDTPTYARTLLAAIASCHQSPEAQQTLISEMKASLGRALALSESTAKHSRLQALFTLVQTMIESGPHSAQHATSQPNSVMKLLLKKGLVNDLARVPHSLDLASPNFVGTVNCLLKPLEKLSGVVNQQSASAPLTAAGKERTVGGDQQANGGQGAVPDSESQQAPSAGMSQCCS